MEKVLCIKQENIPNEWLQNEVAIGCDDKLETIVKKSNFVWVDKKEADKNDSLKQIINYVIVENWSDEFGCCYKLDENYSLGMGKNIEETYADDSILYMANNALTEHMGELFYDWDFGNSSPFFKGVVHSKSNNNLIGLVFHVTTYYSPAMPCDELENFQWINSNELKNYRFDSLSKLALELMK